MLAIIGIVETKLTEANESATLSRQTMGQNQGILEGEHIPTLILSTSILPNSNPYLLISTTMLWLRQLKLHMKMKITNHSRSKGEQSPQGL